MLSPKSLLQHITRFSALIFFPSFCLGCRRKICSPGTVCPCCWSGLRFLEKPCCDVTGVPFPYDMGEGVVFMDALAQPFPFRRLRSAVSYSGIAREMVHALKYHDRTDLAPWMASWMMRAGRELITETEVIVPVPLHRSRFRSRMFNQAAELARALALRSKQRFLPTALERIKNTSQQVHLDIKKRKENVEGAFKLTKKGMDHIVGKRVLLIDDVFTTGATINSASQELREGGASTVDVLTFARVLPKGHFMEAA